MLRIENKSKFLNDPKLLNGLKLKNKVLFYLFRSKDQKYKLIIASGNSKKLNLSYSTKFNLCQLPLLARDRTSYLISLCSVQVSSVACEECSVLQVLFRMKKEEACLQLCFAS
jgi:hypothetical protein